MNDLDFCRGVWYAIQMLVVELRAPSMAANIAREANFPRINAWSSSVTAGFTMKR